MIRMIKKVARCGSPCGIAFALAITGLVSRAETPDALLDYIQATAAQYIDTGVNAETGLKARIDLSWEGESATGNDWSCLDARSGNTRMFLCHLFNNMIYSAYGFDSRGNPGYATTLTRGTRYEFVTDFSVCDANTMQVYQNGKKLYADTDIAKYTANGNIDLKLNLYLFACNYDGTDSWKCRCKLYGLKIMKMNAETHKLEVIRHYLPCLKNGRAALYDAVNGTISFSATGTDFIAGPVLTDKPCELVTWIESSTAGSPNDYIDTGVYGKSGLKSDVDCSIRWGFADDQAILACRYLGGTDTRFFLAYFYQSYFGYGYKTGYWGSNGGANPVKVQNDASARYRIISDLSVGRQSVTVNGTELHKEGVAHDESYLATETTLTFFGLKSHDNSVGARSNIRLYSAKIWDGDELLRDFVPCVDDSGQAGLYDSVTRRMYKSSDAYDFTFQVGAVTNAPAVPTGTLPDTRIGYIESDGASNYFDLEVTAKDGVEVEAVMEWVTVPGDNVFVGAVDGSNRRFMPLAYSTSSKFYMGYVADICKSVNSGVASAQPGVKYSVTARLDGDKSQFMSIRHQEGGDWVWDGPVGGMSFSYPGPLVSELSLCLFARNNLGTPDLFTRARVYRLKLRERQQDGSYKLVRDLVPCRYDGMPMLYDKVGERFFRHKGGSYFIAAGGVERDWNSGTAILIR